MWKFGLKFWEYVFLVDIYYVVKVVYESSIENKEVIVDVIVK